MCPFLPTPLTAVTWSNCHRMLVLFQNKRPLLINITRAVVSAGETASGGGEEAAGVSQRSAEAGRPHRAGQKHRRWP